MSFENYKNLWVLIETEENTAKNVGYELLTPGRQLADKLGEELVAVVIGADVEAASCTAACAAAAAGASCAATSSPGSTRFGICVSIKRISFSSFLLHLPDFERAAPTA